jgi:ribonuclease HII
LDALHWSGRKDREMDCMSLWEYEEECWAQGHALVCGCDEAGAGPLAGPVYAAAVLLPRYIDIPGLDDSKQLTEKRREGLFPVIQERAEAWAVAFVEAEEIDATDILSARMKAMQRAVDGLEIPPDFALIDGNRDKGRSAAITVPHCCVIKGDSFSASIAAASILAKVSRDRFMVEMAERYPEYGFEQHKGYGTKYHYEMLDKYGPSPIHRRTFLKKWEERR